jgi:hypothetical protein
VAGVKPGGQAGAPLGPAIGAGAVCAPDPETGPGVVNVLEPGRGTHAMVVPVGVCAPAVAAVSVMAATT